MSVATPTLADDRQAPPPDTTSGSLHCHGKVRLMNLRMVNKSQRGKWEPSCSMAGWMELLSVASASTYYQSVS